MSGISIRNAHTMTLSSRFFSYSAGTPYSPPYGCDLSQSDWDSLSPGMRREIAKWRNKANLGTGEGGIAQPKAKQTMPTRQDLRDHKLAVEQAAKERL